MQAYLDAVIVSLGHTQTAQVGQQYVKVYSNQVSMFRVFCIPLVISILPSQ